MGRCASKLEMDYPCIFQCQRSHGHKGEHRHLFRCLIDTPNIVKLERERNRLINKRHQDKKSIKKITDRFFRALERRKKIITRTVTIVWTDELEDK